MNRALRTSARLLVLTLLTSVLVVDPSWSWLPTRSLSAEDTSIALAFAAEQELSADGEPLWTSEAIEGDATVTGVTWDTPEDEPSQVEYRVRDRNGWSTWAEVHTADDHAPDPGTTEAAGARTGTSPIIVAGSEAVQFRVAERGPPAGLEAMIVSVDDPDAARRQAVPLSADAAPARPSIKTRADWSGSSCVDRPAADIDYVDDVQMMFVHHTAGVTNYTRDQVASIINGICRYHVDTLGWSDIGYNALVDRFGQVWEGRAGGIDKGVMGAHTGGYNSYSTGTVFLGNHETDGGPTTAAKEGFAAYAAWKLSIHGVDPTSEVVVRSTRFGTIAGHRDASPTACPGQSLYDQLAQLRSMTKAALKLKVLGFTRPTTVYDMQNGAWPDVIAAARFNSPAEWSMTIRDVTDGSIVRRTTGTGTSTWIRWTPESGGTPALRGTYRLVVRAVRSSDGDVEQRVSTFDLHSPRGVFGDVPSSHTFVANIARLAEGGVTRGCSPPLNLRFCPAGQVTRGQMAAFLVRAMDLPPGDAVFTDTKGHRFEKDAAALAAAGITSGCGSTTFCPDDPVTRGQMAAFLQRSLRLRTATATFSDTRGHRFEGAISALATAGITKGCGGDRFCPDDVVTRAQMAAFLVRGGLAD